MQNIKENLLAFEICFKKNKKTRKLIEEDSENKKMYNFYKSEFYALFRKVALKCVI